MRETPPNPPHLPPPPLPPLLQDFPSPTTNHRLKEEETRSRTVKKPQIHGFPADCKPTFLLPNLSDNPSSLMLGISIERRSNGEKHTHTHTRFFLTVEKKTKA
jgi:hypothetical protein